ncbi:hypothetical protein DFH07DRAFT_775727 [Mycena maculata]|uniref:Uncharacterized protein n=1 Tax=Mycena maculata TaxID=230809 RepID=A0AAD7N755_9AGAR|nr:hypothetical protein DFH07DRAFT_775727 [Mycena maculata]
MQFRHHHLPRRPLLLPTRDLEGNTGLTPQASGGGGATYGPGKTTFEEIRDEEILKGVEVLGPFRDEAEWELAKWLIKHVGHNAANEFLKLSITLTKDPTGATMRKETVELWWRDPVECVRELMGNPMFRDVMRSVAPEELYADEKGEIRVINEMWTGDWWREIQVRKDCLTIHVKETYPELETLAVYYARTGGHRIQLREWPKAIEYSPTSTVST